MYAFIKIDELSTAALTSILHAFVNARMALSTEGKRLAFFALAAIEVMRLGRALDYIIVTAIGRQLIDIVHNRLPLWAVRANRSTVDRIGHQMCHFMGNGMQ